MTSPRPDKPALPPPPAGFLAVAGVQMVSGTADEPEDEHHFHGEMYYLTITTGQSFRVLYKSTQLLSLRDDLNKALEENGFDKVQPENELLQTVIFGGAISLKGRRFINRQSYPMDTMKEVFMKRQRALVHAIMNIVFNKEANVPYMRKVTPLKGVKTQMEFDNSIAFRKTTTLFLALGDDRDDLYRVIIEGNGKGENLYTHLLEFQPSLPWLCNRYPRINGD